MHVWINDKIVRIRMIDYDFVTCQIVDRVEITTVHVGPHLTNLIAYSNMRQ